MRRVFLLLTCLTAIVLGACTGDSSLPTATGKGSIRAINAIKTSPDFGFLIEERLIAAAGYKGSTGVARYDDLDYTFNFEVLLSGNTAATRVASQFLHVIADKDFVFLISGALTNPTITLWEGDERSFDGTETVFEARFGHASESLGPVDVYLTAPGTAPAIGMEVATLSFGEVVPAVDFAEGDYVITVTPAGDPSTIHYVSDTIPFAPQNALIITVFDADANDTAPVSVRAITAGGGSSRLPDVRFPPTARFIHASADLVAADIYDDVNLITPIVTNHQFGDTTADLDVAIGESTISYTATGSPGVPLFDSTLLNATAGTHNDVVAVGQSGSITTSNFVADRRSVETIVKFRLFHAAANQDLIDVYVVDAGTTIDEVLPRLVQLNFGFPSFTVVLDAGSFDVYLTPTGDKTILLAGPVRIDPVLGDVIDAIALDTVDPATAEIRIIP
ncbi:MAG: DUF4397 domain-containing protein [Woeseiaceae bacterium]